MNNTQEIINKTRALIDGFKSGNPYAFTDPQLPQPIDIASSFNDSDLEADTTNAMSAIRGMPKWMTPQSAQSIVRPTVKALIRPYLKGRWQQLVFDNKVNENSVPLAYVNLDTDAFYDMRLLGGGANFSYLQSTYLRSKDSRHIADRGRYDGEPLGLESVVFVEVPQNISFSAADINAAINKYLPVGLEPVVFYYNN